MRLVDWLTQLYPAIASFCYIIVFLSFTNGGWCIKWTYFQYIYIFTMLHLVENWLLYRFQFSQLVRWTFLQPTLRPVSQRWFSSDLFWKRSSHRATRLTLCWETSFHGNNQWQTADLGHQLTKKKRGKLKILAFLGNIQQWGRHQLFSFVWRSYPEPDWQVSSIPVTSSQLRPNNGPELCWEKNVLLESKCFLLEWTVRQFWRLVCSKPAKVYLCDTGPRCGIAQARTYHG